MGDLKASMKGLRLSLASLFFIVTACAMAVGLYRILGGWSLLMGAYCWVLLTGVGAYRSRKFAAYWRCVVSGVIMFLLIALPVNPRRADLGEVGFICLFLGFGGYLAVSTLWNAHWATRILGGLLSVGWAMTYYQWLAIGGFNLRLVYHYWLR